MQKNTVLLVVIFLLLAHFYFFRKRQTVQKVSFIFPVVWNASLIYSFNKKFVKI